MAILPGILPPMTGLMIAVVLYAIGGGMIEVLISPIVEACPTEGKSAAMSLLHSFYCWGHVALVLLSTFCLELRDQDTKWLFAELRGEPVSEPSDFRSIDERCEEVGKQHGLTPRELEIMQLLCKGRTKAYIAETLYLTENTVKGHTKHIYSKLDVHSKQELMDMVEKSAS